MSEEKWQTEVPKLSKMTMNPPQKLRESSEKSFAAKILEREILENSRKMQVKTKGFTIIKKCFY